MREAGQVQMVEDVKDAEKSGENVMDAEVRSRRYVQVLHRPQRRIYSFVRSKDGPTEEGLLASSVSSPRSYIA